MTAVELLTSLTQQGVHVWADGDRLRCRAPRDVLIPSLRAELAQHKEEILALLNHRDEDRTCLLPTITSDLSQQYQSFPLTDIQQAYWIGRSAAFELGNVAAHSYLEFENDKLDMERFNQAWQMVIERHEMLRAIVLPDGQQQVLQHVPPYQIEIADLRGQPPEIVAAQLEATRQRMSHQVLRTDQWPLFEIRTSLLDGQRVRMHLSFDVLIADAQSFQIFFRDLQQFYNDSGVTLPPLHLSFRDYVMAEAKLRDSELYQRSLEYWRNCLPTLPPAPELPLAKSPASVKYPQFIRRKARLEQEAWTLLKSRAAQANLTPSVVLFAAFAEILATWSKSLRCSLNLTLFNRLPLHSQVNDIVGDFTSMTLLAVDTLVQASFESRARRIQEQLWTNLDYQYISGVQILREWALTQGKASRATVPIVFTSLINGQEDAMAPFAWLGEMVYDITQTPQVWLDHQVFEEEGSLVLNWDAVEELFPDGLMQDMLDAYAHLLHRLAHDEEVWHEVPLQVVPTAQLTQRTHINATHVPLSNELLHTLFTAQVPQRRLQAAVITSERTLSYQDVHLHSNRVAHRLRELRVQPNTLVAVAMEKGWEQVVAVLGILKAGAAYLPLDPDLPEERRGYLLANSEVEVVLTQSWLDKTLTWPSFVQRLCVDRDEVWATVPAQEVEPIQHIEDLAYVIYTSGSTGLPKGVMIDHRGAVNTVLDINESFGVGPTDRVFAASSLSFDLSVYDIFGTLAAGGTIVLPDAGAMRDPTHWAELMQREQVTVWNSAPALMKLLVEYAVGAPELLPRSLRLVLLSGDWIPLALPEQLRTLVPEVQMISLGGATEASIWSIFYPIEHVDASWKSIPYGWPLANQYFHVLNEALEPCPVWVPGHLYIGGIGLAQGYWRDEERTRASFLMHPRTGERLYRTGDLGRYLPNGAIEFLGREDFQVKVQGYRIELGEIETALLQYPGVRDAVVTAVGEAHGEKRLVGYVVGEQGVVPTSSELRTFLQRKLPDYMVPSAFMRVESLPLTSNGKVDRQTLPDPNQSLPGRLQNSEVDRTSITSQIGQLIASVLKVSHVNPDADLLQLGANSLDIVRLGTLLETTFGTRPKMEDFFHLTTVDSIAEYYEQHLLLQNMLSTEETMQKSIGNQTSASVSYKLLLDPEEREEFKNRQPGVRKREGNSPLINLTAPALDESLRKKYVARRSHREFLSQPIPFERFGEFLSCLGQLSLDGKPKYQYASAGSLYPVQTYLHVKANRVEGLAAGTYYYHPGDHCLMSLSMGTNLDRTIHGPINRSAFDESAFSIFLIGQLDAITPLYGDFGLQFATLEAGYMGQLLMSVAPSSQIGLCPIGTLDFEPIRRLFVLKESHVLLHSFLGGLMHDELTATTLAVESKGNNWEEGAL